MYKHIQILYRYKHTQIFNTNYIYIIVGVIFVSVCAHCVFKEELLYKYTIFVFISV